MNFTWFKNNWRTITFHRVINFLQAKYRELTVPPATLGYDQFLWRTEMVTKVSPKCLGGKCIHCGCDTPDKFWESDACEHGCYPAWMDKEEWGTLQDLMNNLKTKSKDEQNSSL